MYGADMTSGLRDANDLPIRDEEGNEVSFLNQWADAPTVELRDDGTKAFLVSAGNAASAGSYRLHFDDQLDLGASAPLLRRSGGLS
ncbi:MAG TPA: hypothetical protein VJG32_04225 [Anaerolineae bacterium]|nr:hypothetical protein [Anaerolineae bacterium]